MTWLSVVAATADIRECSTASACESSSQHGWHYAWAWSQTLESERISRGQDTYVDGQLRVADDVVSA